MQTLALSPVQTLAVALLALQLGYFLTKRVELLRCYYIPAPVVGGLLLAAARYLLGSQGIVSVQFDATLQPLFFAGFFASIGFRASAKLLREGLPKVLLFLLITIGVAFLQKLSGLLLAPLFGLSRTAGLLVGSGHMGGMALQPLAVPVLAGQGAASQLPLLGATATLGLLLGGFLGGPLYALLTKGSRQRPASPPSPSPLNPPLLLWHLAAYLVVVAIGQLLAPKLMPYFPAFAVALVAASAWRIVDDLAGQPRLDLNYINTLGNVSLSITLSIAFMNLDLSKLSMLPAGAWMLVLVQILLVLLISAILVYALFGRSTAAAMIAAGLPGFAIGTPPNTMASLQNIQEQNTPAPLVTFVVPVVGAWLITLINPLIFNWVSSLI